MTYCDKCMTDPCRVHAPSAGDQRIHDAVMAVVEDATGCRLLYYDRKECEDVPVHMIEDAVIDGHVTVEEIVACLREQIEGAVADRRKKRGL